jgi:hypothetical protein
MSRRGLAGPIILIAIGTFFLMRRWVDIPPLWTIMREWWPALLIAIGVLQILQRTSPTGRG